MPARLDGCRLYAHVLNAVSHDNDQRSGPSACHDFPWARMNWGVFVAHSLQGLQSILPSSRFRIGIVLNTLVHVFMYYYFSLAALGKTVWWKSVRALCIVWLVVI